MSTQEKERVDLALVGISYNDVISSVKVGQVQQFAGPWFQTPSQKHATPTAKSIIEDKLSSSCFVYEYLTPFREAP